MISNDERAELLRLACSASLRKDMRYIATHRHSPVVFKGEVSLERLIRFLNQFNECINHEPRPFKPIIDRDMRL